MNQPTVSGEEFICRCSYTQYFSLGEVLFISTGMVKLVEIISCGFILFIWEVGGKGGFFPPSQLEGIESQEIWGKHTARAPSW